MKKHRISKQTRILFLLIFLASLIMVGFGPSLYRTASNDASETFKFDQEIEIKQTYMNSTEIMEKVLKASVPLYLTYLEGITPKEDIPKITSDLLLWDAEKLDEQTRTNFQTAITEGAKESQQELPQLQYYIRGHSDVTKEYVNDDLLEGYFDGNPVQIYDSYWYVAFTIDKYGNLNIAMSNTMYDSLTLNTTFQRVAADYTADIPNISIKNIKDVDFVFALSPSALKSIDIGETTTYTSYDNSNQYFEHYQTSNVIGCYFIILGFFLLVILLLPFEAMKKSKLIEWAITKQGACLVLIGLVVVHVVLFTEAARISTLIAFYSSFINMLVGLFGFMIIYLFPALAIFICKKIYFKSTKKLAKDTSDVYHLLSNVDESAQRFKRYISTVSFSSLMKKKLVIISALNALAVLFIMFIFVSSNTLKTLILLLILYAGVIYVLLYKYFKTMKKDHDILSDVICRLSKGDFHQNVEEDMGMFNTLKESILVIQTDFQNAVEQEVHSQKMKTELITNVSHDLKTPLTSMISYIDLLKDPSLDQKTRAKYVGILEDSSARLKHLIENLFEISKANSGSVALEYMDVDVLSLLQQVETECDVSLKQRHLQLRNQFPKDKVILSLDSQKAYRIFENLISNVSKYALEKTRVYVNVEDFGSMVEVSIKNVSKSELNFDPEEIMERFTRGDKSRNTEGSGLGLAIAKSFTELLGGNMKIQIDGDLFKVTIRFYRSVEEES
ncbi:MAG: sensor histidine kinase [Longicatena sp.]